MITIAFEIYGDKWLARNDMIAAKYADIPDPNTNSCSNIILAMSAVDAVNLTVEDQMVTSCSAGNWNDGMFIVRTTTSDKLCAWELPHLCSNIPRVRTFTTVNNQPLEIGYEKGAAGFYHYVSAVSISPTNVSALVFSYRFPWSTVTLGSYHPPTNCLFTPNTAFTNGTQGVISSVNIPVSGTEIVFLLGTNSYPTILSSSVPAQVGSGSTFIGCMSHMRRYSYLKC